MFRSRKSSDQTPIRTETPKQMLARVEAELNAKRLLDNYNQEVQQRTQRVQSETSVITSAEETAKRNARNEKIINYSPLVVINGLAIVGQYGHFVEDFTPTFGSFFAHVIAALCAMALETITLFVSYHGMLALRRRDSAAGLLFMSVILGTVVASLNYTYFAKDDLTPTAAAIAFGMFSFISPFLWRIKIRSEHRDELYANGEIDKRGLKLERSRLVWHPLRSLSVLSLAAWTGQRDVDIAVKDWEVSKGNTEDEHAEAIIMDLEYELEAARQEIEAIRAAYSSTEYTVERVRPRAIRANGYQTEHPKWDYGLTLYSEAYNSDQPMTQAELARAMKMTNRGLASQIMRYHREGINHERGNGSVVSSETE